MELMYWDSPPWPRWTILEGASASMTAMATEECQPVTIILTPRFIAWVTAFFVIGGLVVLHETMPVQGVIGCALMLGGVILAQLGPESMIEPAKKPSTF